MTGFNAKKRAFFRRLTSRNNESIRPPWAVDEYHFVEICRDCTACSQACPESIIQFDHQNKPIIDFQKGECTFCKDCVSACETGALSEATSEQQPWNAKAVPGTGCLSEKNILCRTCGDICEHKALYFPLALQGIISPKIDNDKCTGCGACVAICPTQALNVYYQN